MRASEPYKQSGIFTKKKLQDLVREVDPNEKWDKEVEEMLLQIAEVFIIESVVTAACQLAQHRKSSTLEVQDVQLHLERSGTCGSQDLALKKSGPTKKLAPQKLTDREWH